jgi:hypothetical protein
VHAHRPDAVCAQRELRALRAELNAFERVRAALNSGASISDVARGLGITRHAADRRSRYSPGSSRG